MKTGIKIALGLTALAALLFARKKGIAGVGYASVPYRVLDKAKKLFDAYDSAIEIEREHDANVDVIYEDLQARGIDPFADENEGIVIDALYRAGLTDKNGMTDVSVNRLNARKELLNFINDNIVSLFPIPESDRALLKNTYSVVYQNRLLDITRNFVNKLLS